jgi:hypothetical protein
MFPTLVCGLVVRKVLESRLFWCGDSMNAATLCQAAGQRADWRQRRLEGVQWRTTLLKSADV